MWLATLAVLLYLHGDRPVDPAKMAVGDSACVFPVHFTVEGNIWISKNATYLRPSNEPNPCIVKLRKVSPVHWIVQRDGIPIRMQDSHDAELKSLEFIKLGPAYEVLR